MKNVSRRTAHFQPPIPKMIRPVKKAAMAPLLFKLFALYARDEIRTARRKPKRSCMGIYVIAPILGVARRMYFPTKQSPYTLGLLRAVGLATTYYTGVVMINKTASKNNKLVNVLEPHTIKASTRSRSQ